MEKKHDNPLEEHKKHSPDCLYLKVIGYSKTDESPNHSVDYNHHNRRTSQCPAYDLPCGSFNKDLKGTIMGLASDHQENNSHFRGPLELFIR